MQTRPVLNQVQRKLLNKAFSLLARRAYSQHDMQQRLQAYNAKLKEPCSDQESEQVLQVLILSNFLNDEKYIEQFVDSQLRRKPQGRKLLQMKLQKKGVDRELIEQKLQSTVINELELATIQATKKHLSLSRRQTDEKKIREKLYRFLLSRGFESSVVNKVIIQKLYK